MVGVHHADNKWLQYSAPLASPEPWTLPFDINDLREISKRFISAQRERMIKLEAEIAVSKRGGLMGLGEVSELQAALAQSSALLPLYLGFFSK